MRGRLELSSARRAHRLSQKTKTSCGHLLPIRGMSPGYGTQALLGRSWQMCWEWLTPNVRIFVTPPLAIHSCGVRTAFFRIQDRISSTPTHLRDQMHSLCKLDLELLGQWGVGVNTEQGWMQMAPCSTQQGGPTQDSGCVILSLSLCSSHTALFSQERVSLPPTNAQLLREGGRKAHG